MKRTFIIVRFAAIALLIFECGSAAFAQGEKTDLGAVREVSRSSFTGAGAGGGTTTAAKPGGADGQGNLLLGRQRNVERCRHGGGGGTEPAGVQQRGAEGISGISA